MSAGGVRERVVEHVDNDYVLVMNVGLTADLRFTGVKKLLAWRPPFSEAKSSRYGGI